MRETVFILAIALNVMLLVALLPHIDNLFLVMLPAIFITMFGAFFWYSPAIKSQTTRNIGWGLFVGNLVAMGLEIIMFGTMMYNFRGID